MHRSWLPSCSRDALVLPPRAHTLAGGADPVPCGSVKLNHASSRFDLSCTLQLQPILLGLRCWKRSLSLSRTPATSDLLLTFSKIRAWQVVFFQCNRGDCPTSRGTEEVQPRQSD